jgi:hypothetical protein
MDDFFGALVALATAALVVLGSTHLFMDFRHFDAIEKQCTKAGFIQNQNVRILCTVEPARKTPNAQ